MLLSVADDGLVDDEEDVTTKRLNLHFLYDNRCGCGLNNRCGLNNGLRSGLWCRRRRQDLVVSLAKVDLQTYQCIEVPVCLQLLTAVVL